MIVGALRARYNCLNTRGSFSLLSVGLFWWLRKHCSQDMRQQLNEERQNVRRITLQREVEAKELRNSIDNQVCLVDSVTWWYFDMAMSSRHGTFKRRAVRLSRQRRPKRTSNSEWRNFLVSYKAMRRS